MSSDHHLGDQLRYVPMRDCDLEAVAAMEASLQADPWSRGNFADALTGGYFCRILQNAATQQLSAYAVVLFVLDEAHLLVLGVAATAQRQGLATALMRAVLDDARARGAANMLLEVRLSNAPAQALYQKLGFQTLHVRRAYYPAHSATEKREDALVMIRALEHS